MKPKSENNNSNYGISYRVIKTFLMVLTWISYGSNTEIIGSTFEDYKILIDSNYEQASFGLELRGFSNLLTIPIFGIIFDKYEEYSGLLLAFGCLLMGLPNPFIPVTKEYWSSMFWFAVQGVGTSFYDVGGNSIILNLWRGISSSPISIMHAGYGVGAMVSVFITKKFIKYDPNVQRLWPPRSVNNTVNYDFISSDDINLKVPYWISSLICFILCLLFIIDECFLINRSRKLLDSNRKASFRNTQKLEDSFMKRALFGDENLERKKLFYYLIQMLLITLFVFIQIGYATIVTKFMLTYIMKGPAKLQLSQYVEIQALYWLFFVVGRIVATLMTIKISPLVFLFFNLFSIIVLGIFYMIPYFACQELFQYIAICFMGLLSGPMNPVTYMAARNLLIDYNSYVLSIFCLGMGLGKMLFQEIGAEFLDLVKPRGYFLGFMDFNSAYLIPHIFSTVSLMCFLPFSLSIFIQKKYFYLLNV